MPFRLRTATLADLPAVLPRTRALNAHESIVIADAALEAALRTLLGDASLGGVWVIEDDTAVVGYAIVTYGYDLEFGGRDAYLTELWIDPGARGHGAGTAAQSRSNSEIGSMSTATVPSENGFFSAMRTRSSGPATMRSCAIGGRRM